VFSWEWWVPGALAITPRDAPQDAIGLLGSQGTLLAPVQVAVDQHPQVLFLKLGEQFI